MAITRGQLDAAFEKSGDATATETDQSGEQDPRIQALWEVLEPSLEERGTLEHEVRGHLRESTRDISSWRIARHGAGVLALVVIVAAFAGLALMITPWGERPAPVTLLGNDSVRVAFIAGSFATIFGLTALIVRGAFGHQRRDDGAGVLPDNLKILVDTFGPSLRSKL